MTTKKTPEPQNVFMPEGEQAATATTAKAKRATAADKLAELEGRLIHLDDATRQDFARIIQEVRDAL